VSLVFDERLRKESSPAIIARLKSFRIVRFEGRIVVSLCLRCGSSYWQIIQLFGWLRQGATSTRRQFLLVLLKLLFASLQMDFEAGRSIFTTAYVAH